MADACLEIQTGIRLLTNMHTRISIVEIRVRAEWRVEQKVSISSAVKLQGQ